MSLADTMHHAGPQALLVVGHGEPDRVTDLQTVEPVLGHAVAVKIDLLTLACLDEPVPAIGNEPDDAAAENRRLMMLYPPVQLADMILELACHGVEGITHRHMGILVRVIPRALARRHDSPARHHQLDAIGHRNPSR